MDQETNKEHELCSYEELERARKITFRDFVDHLTGPVFSIILHIALFAVLATIVVVKPAEERDDLVIEEIILKPLETPPIPDPPPLPKDNLNPTPSEAEFKRPDVEASEPEIDEPENFENFDEVPTPIVNLTKVPLNKSALKLPGSYSWRGRRGEAARKGGGGGRTVQSVDRSLCWLAEHQNEDGSWGDRGENVKAAITGLALLAFLANNQTSAPDKLYASTVYKAMRKLTEYMDKAKAPQGIGSRSYEHAIVTYALAEANVMHKLAIDDVRESQDKGIRIIVAGQNSNGSFNYGYKNAAGAIDPKTGKVTGGGRLGEPRSDLSVAGWNYQAMKAALISNCSVDGLTEAFDKSVSLGLKKTHRSPGGGFSYSGFSNGGSSAKHTMTAVGTLCLQLLGAGNSKEARDGMNWMIERNNIMTCDWRKPKPWSLYAWYYQTQAIFQADQGRNGKRWKHWNKQFSKAFLREQAKDGHWTSPWAKYGENKNGKKAGHGENAHSFQSELNLHVYSTAICSLTLSVYYRILQSYDHVKPVLAMNPQKPILEGARDLGLDIR